MVIFAVAHHTARILWNRKLWGCAASFAGIVLMTALWLTQLAPGIEGRLLVDVELVGMELAGFAGAILSFAILAFEEQELRTIWLVLVKPIRRYEFLLGKFLGIFFVLAINFSLMSVWLVLVNMAISVPLMDLHWWAIVVGNMKWMVAMATLTVVSVWASSAVSLLLLGSMVVFIGHVVHHVRVLLQGPMGWVSKTLLWVLYYAFPNFHYFNVREVVWSTMTMSWGAAGTVGGYAIGYIVCAVGLACLMFSKKEFV